MADIRFNQFDAGWIPSDDPAGGRKNGLLQMDNLELDRNGALTLTGGTSVVNSGFAGTCHTLFSRLFGSSRKDYEALSGGTVFRNASSIITGGDTTNAAFCSAFDFTLIASGTQRKKDNGTALVNLGVGKATVAPVLTTQTFISAEAVPLNASLVDVVGTSAPSGGNIVLTLAGGAGTIQTYNAATAPFDMRSFTGGGVWTDNDIIYLEVTSFDPATDTFQLDLLLQAGNVTGDPVDNVFTFIPTADDVAAAVYSGPNTVKFKIRRSQFQRVGNGIQDWDTVYGYRLTYTTTSGATTLTVSGGALIDIEFYGGSHSQEGPAYEYAQVNVNQTGFYTAKSEIGPASLPISAEMVQSQITFQAGTTNDAQVTEVWLFRRSYNGVGNLPQWYRVAVIPIASGTSVVDILGDEEAYKLGITINLNLTTIASSGIADKIFDIVGPIQGRWYYFTTYFMYPSDINNPDLVDTTLGVRISGSSSEKFMWARMVGEQTILVGTSLGIYVLTGTFATLPDFTVDIYYRPLGCKFPPITYDAVEFGGRVFYLSSDGWRSFDVSGANPLLVAPNTDRLYRGITCGVYSPPSLKIAPGATRFPIAISGNKMWCFITGTTRCEVWDFIRTYWRTFDISLQATAAFATTDGYLLTYHTDGKSRQLDLQSSKLIDAATSQTATMLSPILDGGVPKQRKDSFTVKVRCSGGGTLALSIITDAGTTVAVGNITLTSTLTDYPFDIGVSGAQAVGTVKTYQFKLTGAVTELVINDVTVDFELRPPQVNFLRIPPSNFGSAGKKRLRVWPVVMDTLGNSVTATISSDGSADTPVTGLTSSERRTLLIKTVADLFGIDYGLTLRSTGLFEFYEVMQPDIVQVLPVARRFDQVGPAELFKYGRIKQFEIRVMPIGGTTLPYIIYFNDASSITGNITMTDNVEKSYFLGVPKGVGGEIVRIVLGPTAFDFHRYYMRIQVMKSGRDTELEWIGLPETG